MRELQPKTKLSNRFQGPLRVAGRDAHGNYFVETVAGVQLPRAVPRHQLKAVSGVLEGPGAEPDDAAPFDNVLGARVRGGEWQYLVRWAGEEDGGVPEDEWVPESNFASVEAMVSYRSMAVVGVDVEGVVSEEEPDTTDADEAGPGDP